MKRKLYFFLERLEISKNERISLTILMVLFAILSTASLLYKPTLNYSELEYERLEMLFNEKSRSVEQERLEILSRYEPSEAAGARYASTGAGVAGNVSHGYSATTGPGVSGSAPSAQSPPGHTMAGYGISGQIIHDTERPPMLLTAHLADTTSSENKGESAS